MINLKILRARQDFLPVRAILPNNLFLTFWRARGTVIFKHFDLILSFFNGPQADLYFIDNLPMQFKVDSALILGLLGCKILTKNK